MTRPTQKLRRESGRSYTKIYHPEIFPFEELIWNDWEDYRDGLRDYGIDKTHLHKPVIRCGASEDGEFCQRCSEVMKYNKKIKRELEIRKIRKQKVKK